MIETVYLKCKLETHPVGCTSCVHITLQIFRMFIIKARLAQLVERRTFNPVAAGSIPVPGTKFLRELLQHSPHSIDDIPVVNLVCTLC